jgi:hypothetical protein
VSNSCIVTTLKLPISFAELWLLNSERNPDRVLRNANDYYIPHPRIELVKRLPLFSFPTTGNSETDEKFIPSQPTFLKSLKKNFLKICLCKCLFYAIPQRALVAWAGWPFGVFFLFEVAVE